VTTKATVASVQASGDGLHEKSPAVQFQASTTPNVDIVLSRLDRVRKSGMGWTARCPAHKDRNASLSVGIGREGKIVVVHCYAGCAVHDVLTAIGLSVGDLYPRRLRDLSPEGRRQARRLATIADWSAALGVLEREAGVVLIAGGDIANEKPLTLPDHQRLALAIQRIGEARLVLIGGRRD
jgi:hypothetical protein